MKTYPTHSAYSYAIDNSSANTLAPTLLSQCTGFFFAFRLFFVLLAVRLFGHEAKDGMGASLALNYMLFAIVVFHSIGSAPRRMNAMLSVPGFHWVMLFLSFTGISLLWSSTASLAAAVAFWCAMVADTAIVILLLRTGPVDKVASAIMKGYIRGVVAIAAIAWLMPSQSDLRLGDEELLGPNQIGYACAFALFFVQYLMRRKDGSWNIHAILLSVTLLRSLSKTTIIAFTVAQAYVLFRDRTITHKTKQILILSSMLVLAIFSSLLAKYYDVYTNAGNQSETLSGRLGIWLYFLNESIQQPWIGHGFHSVWKVIPPFGPDQFEARHAHNELLQQFYAYGAVGVVMLVAIYSILYKNLRRLDDSTLKVSFLSMLLFVIIRGFADTEAFDLSLPMWTIVMIGSLIEKSKQSCREQEAFS